MKSTLLKIKEEEAKKRGYEDWVECVNSLPKWNLEHLLSEIAERHINNSLVINYGVVDEDGNVYRKGCFGDSLDKMREKGYTVIESEPREVKR